MVSAITPNEMPLSRSDLLTPGTVLGRHRVEGKLAEGAMATLYLGEHVQTRAVVAIKVLKWAFADDPEALARFDREGIVMGRLSSASHVVHVIDVGRTPDGRRYLVMDFVRGSELLSVVAIARRKSQEFGVERACRIARDLAAGICDVHAKNVVHRDIKPANIMLYREADGREAAKIVDFGVSADLLALPRAGAAGAPAELTVSGSVIGTLEYMAPEQAAGLAADPAMDVFAIGMVLWELLTLQLLPRARIVSGEPLDVTAIRKEVPVAVAELLRECLAREPSARPDAGAVAQRLNAALLAMSGSQESLRKWSDARPKEAAGAIESPDPEAAQAAAAIEVSTPRPAGIGPNDLTPRESEKDDGEPASPPVAEDGPSGSGAGPVIVLVGVLALVGAIVVASMGMQGDEPPADEAKSEPGMSALPPPGSANEREEPPPTKRALPSVTDEEPEPAPATSEAPSKPTRPEPAKATAPEPAPSEPAKASPESPACMQARADALAAAGDLSWKIVLAQTAERACWPSPVERLRLRVEALSELKKFDACVREGEATSDAKVARIVGFCKKRLGQG